MIRYLAESLLIRCDRALVAALRRYHESVEALLAGIVEQRDTAREREGSAVRARAEAEARRDDAAAALVREMEAHDVTREELRRERLAAGQARRELAEARDEAERLSALARSRA